MAVLDGSLYARGHRGEGDAHRARPGQVTTARVAAGGVRSAPAPLAGPTGGSSKAVFLSAPEASGSEQAGGVAGRRWRGASTVFLSHGGGASGWWPRELRARRKIDRAYVPPEALQLRPLGLAWAGAARRQPGPCPLGDAPDPAGRRGDSSGQGHHGGRRRQVTLGTSSGGTCRSRFLAHQEQPQPRSGAGGPQQWQSQQWQGPPRRPRVGAASSGVARVRAPRMPAMGIATGSRSHQLRRRLPPGGSNGRLSDGSPPG